MSTQDSAYTAEDSPSEVRNPLAFFEIPVTKTRLHAEVDIPATIEIALHAEAVIAAPQMMESTMRALFVLKFDAQSMAVPCTDRNSAGQLLLNASEFLSSSNATLKKVFVFDDEYIQNSDDNY